MKLSKVKRVVLRHNSLCVARADTGIDVQTWIGCDMAMYPVHELVITPELAARIWELTEKQIRELNITDSVMSNLPTLISRGDLEKLPMLAEAEQGEPNMVQLCCIDDMVILMNQRTGRAYYFDLDLLGPTEGRRQYFAEDNSRVVGVYSDGVLEAAIYAGDWTETDILYSKIGKIAEIWRNAVAED